MDWIYIIFIVFLLVWLIRIWIPKEEPWERKLRDIKGRNGNANGNANENDNNANDNDNANDNGNTSDNGNETEGATDMEERKGQLTESVSVEIGTRDLLVRTLQEMGCPMTFDKDKGIYFTFQGQHFVAVAEDNLLCIDVYYPWWEDCSLYDVEQLAQLKRAINEANKVTRVITYFSVREEDDVVGVHSKKNLLFIPQIPNLTDYLQAMLENFFQTRHFMEGELERLKNK